MLVSVPWLETVFDHFIVAHFYSAFETKTALSITDFLPKSIGLSYSCTILNEMDIEVENDWHMCKAYILLCCIITAGLNMDVVEMLMMRARFWSLVTLQSLKLLIFFKNYFFVAPLQNYFISQGKVFCF